MRGHCKLAGCVEGSLHHCVDVREERGPGGCRRMSPDSFSPLPGLCGFTGSMVGDGRCMREDSCCPPEAQTSHPDTTHSGREGNLQVDSQGRKLTFKVISFHFIFCFSIIKCPLKGCLPVRLVYLININDSDSQSQISHRIMKPLELTVCLLNL